MWINRWGRAADDLHRSEMIDPVPHPQQERQFVADEVHPDEPVDRRVERSERPLTHHPIAHPFDRHHNRNPLPHNGFCVAGPSRTEAAPPTGGRSAVDPGWRRSRATG